MEYINKGKIVRGIRMDDEIFYGKEKNKIVKIHFEEQFDAKEDNIIIEDNGIFNYNWNINQAIERISKSEAVGIDNIPAVILKQSPNSPLMIKLKTWFSKWIEKGEIPKYLMIGKLILISKENNDCPSINNIRPITIFPTITKFFECTIQHNLENIVKGVEFIKTQRGFAKGKSTLDNIGDVLKMAIILKKNKTARDSPILVFFDFWKAYDSVSRPLLIKKLEKLKIPWNINRIIKCMLNNLKFKLGKEIIITKKGLIQGSVLSPLLFIIFINDLLGKFEDKIIFTRAYADDIVCVCPNIYQANTAIDIMKNWCSENKMRINKDKSGILRILKRSGKTGIINNSLDIPEVSSYKYLDITINQSIALKNHFNLLMMKSEAIKRRARMLRQSLVSLDSKITAYNTVFLPQIKYAWKAIFWNEIKGEEILIKFLYQILKWLCNIRHNVSRSTLFNALNLNENGIQINKPYVISIINKLTIGVIKLRTGWLFNKYNKYTWDWEHLKSAYETITRWEKLRDWRTKWSEWFLQENTPVEYALLKLKYYRNKSNTKEITKITQLINAATEDMILAYFKKV